MRQVLYKPGRAPGLFVSSLLKNNSLPALAVSALLLLAIFFKSGLWPMPNISMQWLVSQNLTKMVFDDPSAHYIYSNYLMPAVYAIFDGGVKGYLAYSFLVSFLFLFLIVFWFINHHGKEVAIIEGKVFLLLCFPFSFISFYWIGMDGMTLLLMAAIMLTWKKLSLSLMFGFFLGLQHFEQGVLAFSLLGGSTLLFFLTSKEVEYLKMFFRCLILVVVIAFGKLFLHFIFQFFGIELEGGRDSYMRENFNTFFSIWKNGWPFILWSLLGVSWIFVFFNLGRYWAFLLISAFVFFLMALVGDQTRVGVILLFPSLFFWVLSDKKLWSEMSVKFTILMTVLFFIVPTVVVWGSAHGSVSEHSAQNIKRLIFEEGYHSSSINMMEPFIEEKASVSNYDIGFSFISWSGSDLPSQSGRLENDSWVAVSGDPVGFLTYGPYVTLRGGEYTASVRVETESNNNRPIGFIDVYIPSEDRVLARRELVSNLSSVEFDFKVPPSSDRSVVEIRTFYNGAGRIKVAEISLERL